MHPKIRTFWRFEVLFLLRDGKARTGFFIEQGVLAGDSYDQEAVRAVLKDLLAEGTVEWTGSEYRIAQRTKGG